MEDLLLGRDLRLVALLPEAVDERDVADGRLEVPVGRLELEHALGRLDGLGVVLRQHRDLEEGGHVPVLLQREQAALLADQVVEHHADALQLLALAELVAVDDEQRGQVDARVLVRLHLEALAVPADGVLQAGLVLVLRLHELVLVDAAAQADHVRVAVLLLLQRAHAHLERRLAVALLVPAVQRERVQVLDGRRVDVVLLVRDRLQVVH